MTPEIAPNCLDSVHLTVFDLPIAPEDENVIAQRWARNSSHEDLHAAVREARKEAKYSVKLARSLERSSQVPNRNAALRHLLVERLRCRIAIKALARMKASKLAAVAEVTPDALLRSIEPLGWTSTEFKRQRHLRPIQTVTKDFVTAVGPRAATISAMRSPATGEIRFQCEYTSEGRNILAQLSPSIPMGTSSRGAKAALRDLMVTVERAITESYAGKLLRKPGHDGQFHVEPAPDATSRPAGRPKRVA